MGNALLFSGIESSLREARFGSRCTGRLDLVYTFAFSDHIGNAVKVKFNALNVYVVTADPGEIVCILRSTTERNLVKRFLSLFH